MNLSEEIVQDYLTRDLNLLVKPDMVVKRDEAGKPWTAQIDFVALDLPGKLIYLIEVTGKKSLQKSLGEKLNPRDRTIIESWALK